MIKLDEFTRAYVTCALWSTVDSSVTDSGRPLADHYTERDLSRDTLGIMIHDCLEFQAAWSDDIQDDLSRAGHDFFLTRNHHGAGFWDGDWPGEVAERLTMASHAFGEIDLYVGDDGLIYSTSDSRGSLKVGAV